MNIEELRNYCLQKKGVTENFPFGEETLVFKVGAKIFLLAGLDKPNRFNAKCDPERALELRAEYEEVIPGWHMNKKHWNTVYIDGRLANKVLHQIIDHSYDLVFKSLSKKTQQEILDL